MEIYLKLHPAHVEGFGKFSERDSLIARYRITLHKLTYL